MKKILSIFIWAAVPLLEQRWAIPNGIIIQDLNPFVVFIAAYLGSLLPVPFIMFFFEKIFNFLGKYKAFSWIYRFIEKKITKNKKKFEKYKELVLITFIAIPIPTTGVWTGTAIAAFLKFDFKKSLFCSAIGAFISALIITLMSVFFPKLLGM